MLKSSLPHAFNLPLGLARYATADIPAAALGNEGYLIYDTTTNSVKFSDGSSWTAVGGGGGVSAMAAIGSTPNANGATISGVNLNLEPASASFGGVVTTAAQTFAGIKTLAGTTFTTETSGTFGAIINGTSNVTTAITPTTNAVLIHPTINNTAGTTTINVLAIDTTNTQLTGTTVNLINAKSATVSKFSVDNAGAATLASTLTLTTGAVTSGVAATGGADVAFTLTAPASYGASDKHASFKVDAVEIASLSGTGALTTAAGVTATTGNIAASSGNLSASGTVTGGTGVTATTGNVAASSGAVTASSTVTGGTGVTATTGDVTATSGSLVVSTGRAFTGSGTGFPITVGLVIPKDTYIYGDGADTTSNYPANRAFYYDDAIPAFHTGTANTGGWVWSGTTQFGGTQTNLISNVAAATSLSIYGAVTDGASAIGVIIDGRKYTNATTRAALATAGAKILSLQNYGTEKAYFDKDGVVYVTGSTFTSGSSQILGANLTGAVAQTTGSGQTYIAAQIKPTISNSGGTSTVTLLNIDSVEGGGVVGTTRIPIKASLNGSLQFQVGATGAQFNCGTAASVFDVTSTYYGVPPAGTAKMRAAVGVHTYELSYQPFPTSAIGFVSGNPQLCAYGYDDGLGTSGGPYLAFSDGTTYYNVLLQRSDGIVPVSGTVLHIDYTTQVDVASRDYFKLLGNTTSTSASRTYRGFLLDHDFAATSAGVYTLTSYSQHINNTVTTSHANKTHNAYGISITPTFACSAGTTAYKCLHIDTAGTTTGLTTTLIDANYASAAKFTVSSAGVVTAASTIKSTDGTFEGTSTSGTTLTTKAADSGSNIGLTINNSTALSGSTKLLSVQNNTTEKFSVADDGATVSASTIQGTGVTGTTSVTVGTATMMTSANAAPGSGTHAVGEIVWNSEPAATEWIGWVCVSAGTPGTWKGFGVIES